MKYYLILMLAMTMSYCKSQNQIKYFYYDNGNKKSEHRNSRIDTILVLDTITDVFLQKLVRSEECIYYYENGSKQREGIIKLGKKEGVWRYWHQNGKLTKEEIYDKGKLIETKEY